VAREEKEKGKKKKGRGSWQAKPAWPTWPAWAMQAWDGDPMAPDRRLLHVHALHTRREEERGGQGLPAISGGGR
jgi:hypothetical protein